MNAISIVIAFALAIATAIAVAITIAIDIAISNAITNKSLLFRSFRYLNVRYLNPHCNIRTFKITIFSFKTWSGSVASKPAVPAKPPVPSARYRD